MSGPAGSAAPPVVWLTVAESTQAVAFGLAGEGVPDRTVVVADAQRAGRGRRGRTWEVARGTGLLASIVVRPQGPPAVWPLLSLVAGVAVAEALAGCAGLTARLKWPNDVLAGRRKIAGILLESRGAGGAPGEPAVVVVGIGINVSQADFPPGLADRATSILVETGQRVKSDVLLGALLASFDAWRARLEGEGFEPVRRRWRELADTLGRTVSAGDVRGVAVDLDSDGALVVQDAAGRHRIVAGELDAAGR